MTKKRHGSTDVILLDKGGHSSPENGMCFNEAIAFAAGLPHSDMPLCVSPVIRRFGMTLNDRLDNERRQLLRPFVLRAIGTANDGKDDERREMCARWLLEQIPAIYERAGMSDAAQRVRDLSEKPSDGVLVENLTRILYSVRDEAWRLRREKRAELREAVKAEMKKRGYQGAAAAVDAAADAAAVADADADAVAVAAAVAAADADAVAVAAAAAVAAADADAVADAAAAAVAVAAADAVADAAADAAYGSRSYWKIYDAVYKKVYPKFKDRFAKAYDPDGSILASALDLLDRMLPAEPIQMPAVENAAILFGDLA